MDLRAYLKGLPRGGKDEFAVRCGTTLAYLRKRLSVGGHFGPALAIVIERESGGKVRADELAPEVDWPYIRSSAIEQCSV